MSDGKKELEHGGAELPHRLPDTLPVPVSVTDTYLAAILVELRGKKVTVSRSFYPELEETRVKEPEAPEEEVVYTPKKSRKKR